MKKNICFLILCSLFMAVPGRATTLYNPPNPPAAAFTAEKIANWGTGSCKDVVIKDDLAFCAAAAAGIDIIDISNPARPEPVAECKCNINVGHLFPAGKYLYLTGQRLDGNDYGFAIIDVSDPSHPEVAASVNNISFAGEVKVSGNYAYVASFTEIKIFNISDPTNPVATGSCKLGNIPYTFAISGNYALVANVFRGLQVVDIKNPEAPVLITSDESSGRHLKDIVIRDNFAFVISDEEGLVVFDIENPKAPTPVAAYALPEKGKAIAWAPNGRDILLSDEKNTLYIFSTADPAAPVLLATYPTPAAAPGIAVQNNLAFIAEQTKGLEIIDLTNPAMPQQKSRYDFSGILDNIILTETYAYLGDCDSIKVVDISKPKPTLVTEIKSTGKLFLEKNHIFAATGTAFRIIDISNPGQPEITASLDHDEYVVYSIYVSGSYAYVGSYTSLYIYDVSDPAAPFLATKYDSPGLVYDLVIENNYALIAGVNAGLTILDISDPLNPVAVDGNNPIFLNKIAAKGNYVYAGQSYIEGSANSRITILDISNPKKPVRTASFDLDCKWINNLSIEGEHLNIASDKGLKIFSISDRRRPRELTVLNKNNPVEDAFMTANRMGTVSGDGGEFILYEFNDSSVVDNVPPERVTGLADNGHGFTGIRLHWQAANDDPAGLGIGTYRIFRKDFSDEIPYAVTAAATTFFIDTDCRPGKSYTYTVAACDKSDNPAPESAPITIRTRSLTEDRKIPTTPADFTGTITGATVKLDWRLSFDADSGIKKYEIYKTRLIDIPIGKGPLKRIDATATNYSDTDIIPGADYEYKIRAVDYAGNLSEFSAPITIRIPATVPAAEYHYYLPHFCAADGWSTDFSITNITDEYAAVVLQVFSAAGKVLAQQQLELHWDEEGKGLAPHSQLYNYRLFLRGLPAETAWLKVDSDKELSFIGSFESSTYFELQKGIKQSSSSLLFPVVTNNAAAWTGIALAAPETYPVQISCKAFAENGKLLVFGQPFTLSAHGKIAEIAADIFGSATLPEDCATIRAEATAPIIGLENFSPTAIEMAGLTAMPTDNPAACVNGNFHYKILLEPNNPTPISLINRSSQPAAVAIYLHDPISTSCVISDKSLTLPGNAKFDLAEAVSPSTENENSTLEIVSSRPLAAIRTSVGGGGYAASCALSRGFAEINFSHLRVKRYNNGSNALKIVNLSRINPNRIVLEFFQGDGELLLTVENTIPADSTLVTELRDLLGINYSLIEDREVWVKIKGEFPINGFYSYQSENSDKLAIVSAE